MGFSEKDDDHYLACLRLAGLRGINNTHKQQLVAHYPRLSDIFTAPLDEIKALLLLTSAKLKVAFGKVDQDKLDQQLALLKHHRIDVLLFSQPDYPERLKQIDDAPAVLFVRGDTSLLCGPQLAMVGSRNASPSGLKTAQAFATDFAKAGLTITSGLAAGIDAAAHIGALDQISKTIAVVATGLDQVYPQSNLALAKDIVRKGLIISEFPPLTPPRREHFPRRNRLISGLSLGVLVVEADTRSGSLITARLAGEQGREVFAIPGSIHLPTSRGCHQLIRQGAKLVETIADVLLEIKPRLEMELQADQNRSLKTKMTDQNPLDSDSKTVLNLIDFAPTAIDDIAIDSNLPVELVSSILLQLELAGEIATLAGGQYQRIQA